MIASVVVAGILASVVAISILVLGLQRFRKNSRRAAMSAPGYNPEDITGGGDRDTGVPIPVSEAVSQQVSKEANSVNIAEARSSQVSIVPSINGSEVRETCIVVEADRAKASKRRGLRMIRGIGEKREEKLMSVGIRTIEDLAEADPKDLAVKLGISLKLTSAWVEEAKLIVSRKNV